MTLEEHVLPWLKKRHPFVVKVERISGYGKDLAGDTESGFYSEFEVTISYLDSDGRKFSWGVQGEEMNSLWEHVVSGFDGI